MADSFVWAIPGLPLLAFLLTFVGGRTIWGRRSSINHVISIGCLALAWLLAMATAVGVLDRGDGFEGTLYTWMHAGSFRVDIGFKVDQLTAVMLVVVTTISLLVHVYSVGYMAHEPGTRLRVRHVERDP